METEDILCQCGERFYTYIGYLNHYNDKLYSDPKNHRDYCQVYNRRGICPNCGNEFPYQDRYKGIYFCCKACYERFKQKYPSYK